MIPSIRARKRCFSKKTSLKSKSENAKENSGNELHSKDEKHQGDVLEFAVQYDKVRERVRHVPNDADAKQGTWRVSRYNESDTVNDRLVSELIWSPEGGARAPQTESVITVCRDDDSTLEIADDISSSGTSKMGAAGSCETVSECSAATFPLQVHNFQCKGGECDDTETAQMSKQSRVKSTDETGKRYEATQILNHPNVAGVGKELCVVSISTPQHNKHALSKSEDFPTNTWGIKTHADEIMNPDEDGNLKEKEGTNFRKAAGDELPAREGSLQLNDTCEIYLDPDGTKFCVNRGDYTVRGNYNRQGYKHGFVPQFVYCLASNDDNNARESGNTIVCDQSQGDTVRKIPIITVDSMDYCNLEHETGLQNSIFQPGHFLNDNSACGLGNTKVGDQSKEDTGRKIPIITIDSMDYCNVEHETELQNSDFKPGQFLNSFPASSECNIAQNKKRSTHTRQGYKFSRSASHSDVSSLTLNRNSQFSYSADLYYESLSGPDGIDVIKHSAEGLTDSRRQSLEDVVPELPSRFLHSSNRFGNPSGFVQNLFWWRRPSDITELRSRTNHPCEEEEEEENTECEVTSSDSQCRRHSDNLFCKPKKFLTLRFNQLREMWNKRDRHSGKVRPCRTPSADSVEVVELNESTEDPDIRLREEEKNELIINSLREVVRKCTFMDPMQRPRSEEIYKKLKRLLLK